MSGYITIPLKKGTYVDISKPILKYLEDVKQYGNAADYERPLDELQKLRQDFVDKSEEKNEKTLTIFHRYADQILGLDLKLPLTENQIRIKFKWQDAFPGQRSKANVYMTFASGAYEKACVLFNVAAMEMAVADQQNLDSDDGLKMAAKLFQQASGIFTHLQTFVTSIFSGTESTNDLKPDTLSALATLALAQAQDVFVRKAMNDSIKPSLVAKLCQQCSFLYEEFSKALQNSSVKGVLPKEWILLAAVRKSAFQALAYFHEGLNCRDSKKHGEALTRLNQAKNLMNKCASSSPKPFPFTVQQKLIETEAAKAEKDNSFIYHEIVPDAGKLLEIEKAVLAKPLPVENTRYSPESEDLLDRLLPLAVHQAESKCEERRAEIVQKEILRLRTASQILNNILVTLNLPAAIEDIGGNRLPGSIAEKSVTLRKLGGYQHLERLVSDLPSLMQKCKFILDDCDRTLNEEEAADRQLRSQYRFDWTRTPSENLNGPIRQEIKKHRLVVHEALQADALVRQKFALSKNAISLLSEEEADIIRSLPPPNPALATITSKKFYQDLKTLMKQVEQLKDERSKLEEKIRTSKIGASNRFMAAYKKEGTIYEESVSMAEIERIFGPLREQSSKSIASQERIVKQIQASNFEFEQFKSQVSGGKASVRDAKFKELASAYDNYIELNATTEEGNKFYSDFTLLLEKFQQKVREFCAERNKEREELMKELPAVPSQGAFVGYQPAPQSVYSTQVLYNSLPSATVVTLATQPGMPSAYYYPGATQAAFNPYSVYLHR